MKLTKIFLLVSAAFIGLTACQKENAGNQVSEGNTYVALQMKVNAKPATKGTESTFPGTPAEQLVNQVHLYIVGGGVEKKVFTVGTAGETAFGKDGVNPIYQTLGFKTSAGNKTFYIVVNPSADFPDLSGKSIADFEKSYTLAVESMFAAAHANFVMTGKATQEILPNITQTVANGATAPAQNLVSIDVDRVVSKVAVVEETTLNKDLASGKISDLSFTVVNGNKSLHLFKKTPYVDPNMDGTDANTAWNATWGAQYWKLGDITPASAVTAPTGTKEYTPVAISVKAADLGTYSGKYFLENTNNAWYWGNATYARVYAKFVPKVLDGVVNPNPTTVATFYRGAVDGMFYTTIAKAEAAGNPTSYMYKDGKCGYSVLLNADDYVMTQVSKSPTERNQFYVLEITAIEKVGYNYDPTDPNDPNLEKPSITDNPKEPGTPIGPNPGDPIKTKETFMRVKATVKDWKTITNSIVLK